MTSKYNWNNLQWIYDLFDAIAEPTFIQTQECLALFVAELESD